MPSFATTSTVFDLNKYDKDIRQIIVKQDSTHLLRFGCLRDHGSGRSVLLSHGKQLARFCSTESSQNINKISKNIPSGLYIPLIQQLCSST